MTVRPGQVWVPKPDPHLLHQKIVVAVEDGKVYVKPYGKRRIPQRRSKTLTVAQFTNVYRILWETL